MQLYNMCYHTSCNKRQLAKTQKTTKKHTIILHYYSIFYVGDSLHFEIKQPLLKSCYLFHPYVTFKIVPKSYAIQKMSSVFPSVL